MLIDLYGQRAEGIICLGNHNAVLAFDKSPRVIGINNGIYPLVWNKWREKDYAEGRNIHMHGFIRMCLPEFEALALQCDWVISATSTDGQLSATLECMGYGLIPVLPDSANIDLEDWGIRLPDCRVETIRTVISQSGNMPSEECQH